MGGAAHTPSKLLLPDLPPGSGQARGLSAGGQFDQRGAERRRPAGSSFQRSHHGPGGGGGGRRGQVLLLLQEKTEEEHAEAQMMVSLKPSESDQNQ